MFNHRRTSYRKYNIRL